MEEKDNSVLDEFMPLESVGSLAQESMLWIENTLLTSDVAIQLGLVVGAIVPAAMFGSSFRNFIRTRLSNRVDIGFVNRLVDAVAILGVPLILYLTLAVIKLALGSAQHPTEWISAAIALMNAWIVIRMVSLVIQSPFWSSFAFYVAWPIAALDAFGALGPVIEEMQALAIPLGTNDAGQKIDISLLDVVKTLVYFALLFSGAKLVSKLLEQKIEQIEELSPAVKALMGKIMNVILPIIALLIAFQIVGFNVTTLAVFSGAVGIGIGLGLQGIIANFLAGFTLLADRSIKPGDVIEIEGQMGWVTSMQSRYVALRTREGTELLVPNDRFMSEGVVNWSRSDRVVRIHAPFGVSYQTEDLEMVQQLAINAANAIERVVDEPAPMCNLMAIGHSSIEFDLRFWISDPEEGLTNVRSDVLMGIWQGLKDANIEVPFPQQDLHIKHWPENGAPKSGV
ncbi:MAG: small-conductance mechanosensitive channel [Candidatus Azotimanducaceae bacterium]|jgi:small-conductance mechanosensitive channel